MSHIGVHLTQELLDLLDETFPNQCPRKGTPIDEVWYASGQRSVVDFLWTKYRDTQENLLENSHV